MTCHRTSDLVSGSVISGGITLLGVCGIAIGSTQVVASQWLQQDPPGWTLDQMAVAGAENSVVGGVLVFLALACFGAAYAGHRRARLAQAAPLGTVALGAIVVFLVAISLFAASVVTVAATELVVAAQLRANPPTLPLVNIYVTGIQNALLGSIGVALGLLCALIVYSGYRGWAAATTAVTPVITGNRPTAPPPPCRHCGLSPV